MTKQIRVFEIDCRKVSNFSDFVQAVNSGFLLKVDGGISWNGNLDAFNDFLAWPDAKYQVVLNGSSELEKVLDQPSAEAGLTIYDQVIDIFLSNSNLVRLILR